MESVNFGASGSGAELDRALMDLGPLLGVSIKEEAPDDTADPNSTSRNSGENSVTDGSGASGACGDMGKVEGAEGADSLASPAGAGAGAAAPERCVLCSIPLTLAEGIPKLMECLHSACEPCLKAKIDEKMANNMQRDFLGAERITITCPVCRLPCAAANMIEQRFVMERIAAERDGAQPAAGGAAGDHQCNSCDDTEPATAYCVDCAEFICDNCVQAHQRLKITKDHTIKSKEEALTESAAAHHTAPPPHLYCTDHPQERLSLFCETCDRLTCRDCQLQHHRDHRYQFSAEMAAQARGSIESLLSEVSYKRVLLASAMKVIRDRQTLIADKKKALVHEITQTVVKLTNAINSRGKQLVLRLNEVCDAKQRTLREKKEALEQLAAITHHAATMVRGALDTGSDTAVLWSRGALTRHLQRVKSRRADIPNPEIPVRIALALDNLPELLRVVSSVGAIVVDGKVEGGGGGGAGAGPYHPPAPAPAPGPGPGPHNAVVALQQHAAAMQSYVASGGGSGGWVSPLQALAGAGAGGAGAGAGRPHRVTHTPLRHPHVTSTTHPHHLQGNHELNLRGLLTPAGGPRPAPRQPPPPAISHHQNNYHHYQQMMGAAYAAAAANAGGGGAGRSRGGPSPRTPSPAPPLYSPAGAHHAAAKWHIPQHAIANGGIDQSGASGALGMGGADFKITLGRPPPAPAPPRAPALPNVVTSTNPKTPSPLLNGSGGGGSGALELDAVCAESVQDLMATIAKLDSNGVQVVAEAESPQPGAVHSSTAVGAGAGAGGAPPPDPNEDWCAVCMDGGELMCCDKCPKVFHQYCHIPTIEKLPDETETWQCLLCVNFAELELTGEARTQKVMERITLELYCQYELSLAFREPVPPDNTHYHSKISRPICLDAIRAKLQPRAAARYTHVAQFVQDCRLMFKNALAYNPPDSQIYKDAKRLEEFFEAQVIKLAAEYALPAPAPAPAPAPPYWRADSDLSPHPAHPAHSAMPMAELSAMAMEHYGHGELDEPVNKRQRH